MRLENPACQSSQTVPARSVLLLGREAHLLQVEDGLLLGVLEMPGHQDLLGGSSRAEHHHVVPGLPGLARLPGLRFVIREAEG